MSNITFFWHAIATYEISGFRVNILFSPSVLDAFFSKKEIFLMSQDMDKDYATFEEIFDLIKGRIEKLNTYEIWYDLIEYKDLELVWKSTFCEEKNTMNIEVLRLKKDLQERRMLH